MNRTAITGDLQLRFPVREEEHASSSPLASAVSALSVCARRSTSASRSAGASSHTIVFFLMDKKRGLASEKNFFQTPRRTPGAQWTWHPPSSKRSTNLKRVHSLSHRAKKENPHGRS